MASSAKMRVVLLASEWGSKNGGLSTLNRELAIQLAKHPEVQVSIFVPRCDREEKDAALNNNITLVQATKMPGYDEIDWLCSPPDDLQIDFIIGHGVVLGRQAQLIKRNRQCKWIQFVHTDPEELGMSKDYPDAISKGEKKHRAEVELCAMADFVVAVGPKLAEAYRSYLRFCKKDQEVFVLTPGIFSEFSDVVQSTQEGKKCRVLAFGRGDAEDFHLKGFDIAAKAVAKLNYAHLVFVGAQKKQQEEVAGRLQECSLPPSRLTVRAYKEVREDLKPQFSGVDLVIMPSRTEGFGLAALEALSAGLPVLVGANSGFGEALRKVPFGSGCVISSEDAEVWADAIGKVWATDREVRLQESRTVLENYAKIYDWKKQSRSLLEKMRAIRNDQPNLMESHNATTAQISDPSVKSSPTTEKRKAESSFPETKFPKTVSGPPEVNVTLPKNKDLPKESVPLDGGQLPIDFLLLTVKDCEFLGCLAYMNRFFKSYRSDLGPAYLGDMGKAKVALMKCHMGSTGPGSSSGVVRDAVKILRPKAVFCVGFCGGLNTNKIKLGDVVVSEKLITYAPSKVTQDGIEERGVRVPLRNLLARLILNVGEGWKAPLKEPRELEVKIRRGALLSGPEVVDSNERRNELIKRFPDGIAIEMEGEGVFAAAQDLDVEWIIIKGVSDYADGKKSDTNSWRPFASLMAASLTAHILSDPIVFQSWPHYGLGNATTPSSGEYVEHRRVEQSARASPSTSLEDLCLVVEP